MDELQIKQLQAEVDELVTKIPQDGELSQEVLDELEEISEKLDLIKEKKQLQSSKDLLSKLDQLIAVSRGRVTFEPIISAIKQIVVPEVKIPEVRMPEVKVPPFPEKMRITKPSWITGLVNLEPILKTIEELKKLITNFKLPNDPKKPVAVRLSNGEKFYNALGGLATAVGGAFPFKKSDSSDKAALVDDGGTQYTYIRDVLPMDSTKINAEIELGYNVGGTLIRIRKTVDGVIYQKTLSDDDMTITSTKTISTWNVV